MSKSSPTVPSQNSADRAVVATLILPNSAAAAAADPIDEIRGLAEAAGAEVVGGLSQRLPKVNPRAAFGKGKIEELRLLAESCSADVVIIDYDLSPSQGRNLEKDIGRRVVDRTELILDIFATRAQTRQAKLQVELAQLEYLRTRLQRMWTHLERTEGAVGSRGPGETQLETDRRLINKKIVDLKRRLNEIEGRSHRAAVAREYPYTVSLVGYTNAGKSSMMRRLTGSDMYIADQLFATLDTRIRTWNLPDKRKVILTDTVGFVRDLPHSLVASFHATLEETLNADLLLHICDASTPDLVLQMQAVEEVLKEVEADGIETVLVLNKWDQVPDAERIILQTQFPEAICTSVLTGEGIEQLDAKVADYLDDWSLHLDVEVPASGGRLLADLRRIARVVTESYEGDRWLASLSLAPHHWSSVRAQLIESGGSFKVSSVH
ncbi:MAG: GTPase HflX [Planctomycetota bacterium]|jgi:GTP-binding protein HflX|nr:GTPase HflX [Planctomycetota bacterium]